MSVMFTQEAEKRRQDARKLRNAKQSASWELLITPSLVEALHFARDNGWGDKKVQVKAYRISPEEVEYHVEPYEKDCKCPNLIHYEQYFGGSPDEGIITG